MRTVVDTGQQLTAAQRDRERCWPQDGSADAGIGRQPFSSVVSQRR
ncbi:hypothetical protein [Dactylosporangium darangshiense]